MNLLTKKEKEVVKQMKHGAYYGQIGITIRFGNRFWHECSGTLMAGACGGDNIPTLVRVFKRDKKSLGYSVGFPNSNRNSIAVLDRCGNNWKNGKGGCGPLMHKEYAPTLATMFQPFVIKREKKDA